MSVESVMSYNHLILCHPLLLLSLIFPSIRVFSNESALPNRWPEYSWPSNEYVGLISFRIDWLNLLAVQGTLKSLLQQHSLKTSVLSCSAFLGQSLNFSWASLVAQLVKNPPAVQKAWVRSLGWEDPLEKEMALHSSILAWEIPWTEEPGGLQSMGLQRVGHH